MLMTVNQINYRLRVLQPRQNGLDILDCKFLVNANYVIQSSGHKWFSLDYHVREKKTQWHFISPVNLPDCAIRRSGLHMTNIFNTVAAHF